jgi:hypothetical protein
METAMLHTLVDQSRSTETIAEKATPSGREDPAPSARTFATTFDRWSSAHAACIGLSQWSKDTNATESEFNRAVDRRFAARERASERLAACPAQNMEQLSKKLRAIWSLVTYDGDGSWEVMDNETAELLKSAKGDAERLARTRPVSLS